MVVKAAVVGATGYTGIELVRILLSHPSVEISSITSNSQPGKIYADIFPSFKDLTSIKTELFDPELIAGKSDVVFTALPHGLSMEKVSLLLDKGVKVIDLSADFRFKSAKTYKNWYGEHSSPDLLEESVYGLPELNRAAIRKSRLIANPGCYPTSVILPLLPFIKDELLDFESIVINSASGVSGGGRSLSAESLFCEVNEGFRAYKVGEHRHTPEIEEVLSHSAGENIKVTFIPHLLPLNRGILSTITAGLKRGGSTKDFSDKLSDFYHDEPFVRVCPHGSYPDISGVRGSNYCDIGIKVDERTRRIILVSAIDNLVKGAAGQAVQNMNIIFDLKEDEGLGHIPLSL